MANPGTIGQNTIMHASVKNKYQPHTVSARKGKHHKSNIITALQEEKDT